MSDYDLIVIGTGPSASTVARKIRGEGRRVAIVEERDFGGECALRGCNPKKVYANAGSLMAQVKAVQGQLIETENARIDWSHLLSFKREFTDGIPKRSRESFESDGIDTISGTARFVGRQTIAVNDQQLTAERIYLGVGSRPVPLNIPGAEHVIHSDEFMEREEMPPRVAFIGGGYISMEFAHVVARFGSDVTVVDRNDHVLKGFDPDLTSQLADYSREEGVRIETNANVTAIQDAGNGLRLHFESQGETDSVDCDLVVHGAGRVPNLDSLDLDRAEVVCDDGGIKVDQYLRSQSNPRVFAGGDCASTGQPKLTPTANEEARATVKNLFDSSPTFAPDYGVIPRVAFTTPSLAAVGISEEDARQQHSVSVRSGDSSGWNSVRKTGITCAGYKILVNDDDQIVGAHLLGHGAEETINLFALTMKFGLTARELKSTLFAFPTFSSDIRNMV